MNRKIVFEFSRQKIIFFISIIFMFAQIQKWGQNGQFLQWFGTIGTSGWYTTPTDRKQVAATNASGLIGILKSRLDQIPKSQFTLFIGIPAIAKQRVRHDQRLARVSDLIVGVAAPGHTTSHATQVSHQLFFAISTFTFTEKIKLEILTAIRFF